MSIEVKVPSLPESVTDATIAAIHKKVGEFVERDENLVDLETDKVVLEVPAPQSGKLKELQVKVGDVVKAKQILLVIDETAKAEKPAFVEKKEPAAATSSAASQEEEEAEDVLSPSVRRLIKEHNLAPNQIKGSGKDGRITKEDVEAFIVGQRQQQPLAAKIGGAREEKRVPMSRLRATIAARLVEAQHQAAMLTTFNEVNLQAVINLRAKYKDAFEKKHAVKLGFMSFFTKAVVESLKLFPAVNASIDGNDVVYHGFYDIGVAVSTDRGLVVPVVRDASLKSFAQIEQQIQDSAERARKGKLAIEEMQGGTFTITNGGVFGSLLATPIINPPQTAILGMHKIEERPIAENGQVVIRPMMYIALSYDHRLIDGKESVQFLVSVKNFLEDPTRLLLEV